MKKAYLAIKCHPDHRNRETIDKLSAMLAESGWDTICIARDVERWGQQFFSPAELMRRTFAKIDTCDFVSLPLLTHNILKLTDRHNFQ